MRYTILTGLLFFVFGMWGQMAGQQAVGNTDEGTLIQLAETIRIPDLKKHLMLLASDEFGGRGTGTEGGKQAAEYIAGQFKRLRLEPVGDEDTYFQWIELKWSKWEEVSILIDENEYKQLWDFVAFPDRTGIDYRNFPLEDVVFLGYGIDDDRYSDYEKADIKNRIILIYEGEPVDEDGISQVTGTTELSEWSDGLDKKLETAFKKEVRLVFVIPKDFQELIRKSRRQLLGPSVSLRSPTAFEHPKADHVYLSRQMALDLMGRRSKKIFRKRDKMQAKGKSKPVYLRPDMMLNLVRANKVAESPNVVGYIEGIDPERKDELIVVTAHYDHLGTRGEDIYNGADDNGSGTSTLIELAEAFATAKVHGLGPARSILFMLVTGEELGLLGSRFYVDNPIFPLENTVVNVNVDMIGRVDQKHESNPGYIYVIGADRMSTELHEINESVNEKYAGLELDYTYNREDDPNRYYSRSDHYNFVKKGVPAIFYFSGTHKDYHRPTDTEDKIMYEKLTRVGRLIFHTTWELANRPERIRVDK